MSVLPGQDDASDMSVRGDVTMSGAVACYTGQMFIFLVTRPLLFIGTSNTAYHSAHILMTHSHNVTQYPFTTSTTCIRFGCFVLACSGAFCSMS
ncbi:hypothetical protein ARMGADRAFT_91827 [Armillaria gallica]|uniref:Uncharacterized protein n=1 Tax=Armillaria gallica TaxID=47427 RepID=A0A2H3DGV2_ARMGA|nr:hypothetical protein ARMGADRAFT_91827 [Armillaria gallica]